MAKPLYELLSENERKVVDRMLQSALLFPKKREEMVSLLNDLLTPSEKLLIVRRLQVASKLIRGAPYPEIRQELGVGWDLIRNVHRWLESRIESYRSIIPALLSKGNRAQEESGDARRKSKNRYDPYSFTAIRKRYPGYFLVINMLIDNEW